MLNKDISTPIKKYKIISNNKMNLYIKIDIKNQKLLTKSNYRKLLISKQPPLLSSKRILTQSMNITPARPLSSTTYSQSDRKSPKMKKRIIFSETQALIDRKENQIAPLAPYTPLAQSFRFKQDWEINSSTYLGHYNIFKYISRTNAEVIQKKRLVQSFKDKNKKEKINYALISQATMQKMHNTSNQWDYVNRKRDKNRNDESPEVDAECKGVNDKETNTNNTNTSPNGKRSLNDNNSPKGKCSPMQREKRVKSARCKASSLFVTNLEIVKKLIEEKSKENEDIIDCTITNANIKNMLKQKILSILSQANDNPKSHFIQMSNQLKKEIRKCDYQVKETIDDLRRLQHINDNKLTKKAFILKDIY